MALRATAFANGANFIFSLINAIIIARLLTPREIGVHSVAVSLVAFTHIFREFGVGQYFIQLPRLERDHLRAGFTAMLITSWTIALLLILTARPVAQFYQQSGIRDVLVILAGSFAVLPFGSHILSQLKRDLQFDRIATVQIATGAVFSATSLYLAWAGHSYVSMAWGTLVGNIFSVALLSYFRPDISWLTPTTRHLRSVFSFGSLSSSASVINQLGSSAPDLVLGKTLSVESVAHYSRGSSLLGMVVGKIDDTLSQVFTPFFAENLRRGQCASDMLERAIRLQTGATLPVLFFLAVISERLTVLIFGPQWTLGASLAPWILSYAAITAPVVLAPQALIAGGHVRTVLLGSAISNLALIATLLLSISLELRETVLFLFFARAVTLTVWLKALHSLYGFGASAFWRSIRPNLVLAGLTTVATIVSVRVLESNFQNLNEGILIGGVSAIFVLAFLMSLRLLRHALCLELTQLFPPLGWLLVRAGNPSVCTTDQPISTINKNEL